MIYDGLSNINMQILQCEESMGFGGSVWLCLQIAATQ